MKKTFVVLITLLSLIFVVPAIAATTGRSGLFTYEIKGNGTAIITKYDWEQYSGGDIYIPSMIDGFTVTTIGDNAFSTEFLTKTIKPKSWSQTYKINEYFEENFGTDKYKTDFFGIILHLPDTITSIQDKAFFGAPFSSINIPAGVERIGDGAFACCYLLKSFNVAPDNKYYTTIDGILYYKPQKKLVACPNALLKTKYSILSIPEGIEIIGNYAFAGAREYFSTSQCEISVIISLPSTLI